MADLFLNSKAMTNSYAPIETQPIIRRINDVSPVLLDEAGFYSNPLQTIFKYLSIPQQVLYTFGKNLGEELLQKEVTPGKGFIEELGEAFTGKGSVSFNKVLKAYNLESIDMALPEGFTIDSLAGRLPIAVMAGLASTFATANPVIGITAGFATNSFLGGQGVASSIADVVLDPLNKLRIFSKTGQGLGLSKEVEKQLIKTGRLEDLITNGIVRIPKEGSKKALEDVFEVVVRGKADDIAKAVPKGEPVKLGEDLYSIVVKGASQFESIKKAVKVSRFSRIIRKGDFADEALDTITTENSGLSLLGQLLNGDRRLFDFKGNSGFVLNDTNPFVGGLIASSPFRSIDVLAPVALPAQVLDYSLEGLGKMVNKIPGFETIKKMEAEILAPITAKINTGRKTVFGSFLSSGTEVGLKFRKSLEINLKEGSDTVKRHTKETLARLTPGRITREIEQLNFAEKKVVDLFNRGENIKSSLIQEKAFKADRLANEIKNMAVNSVEDLKTTRLKDVDNPQALLAMESNLMKWLDLTEDDLLNTFEYGSKEYAQQIDHLLDAVADAELAHKDINAFLVKNRLIEDLLEAEDAKIIGSLIDIGGKKLQSEMPTLANSNVPTNKLIDLQEIPKNVQDSIQLTPEAQQWQMFIGKLDNYRKDLLKEKDTALKKAKKDKIQKIEQDILDAFDSKNTSVDVVEKALATTLSIKGIKDVSTLFNRSAPELDMFREALLRLGTKGKDKVKFIFANTEVLGKKGNNDFVVADLIDTSSVKDTAQVAIRLSNMADVRDGISMVGEYFLKNVSPKNREKLLSIVAKKGDKGADTVNRFMTFFADSVMSPKGLLNDLPTEQVSFFGKMVDGFRQFMDYTKGIFFRKEFKNKQLKKKLEDFMKGVEVEETNFSEMFRKKTLVDEQTGKLLDPQGFRQEATAVLQNLRNSKLIPENGGFDVYKTGAGYQPLLVKEADKWKQFMNQNKIASIDISNKGHVGAKLYNSYQRWLKPHNPEEGFFNPIYEQVVIKDKVISENMAKEFQKLRDFSASGSAYQVSTQIVNRISAAYNVILKADFQEELGLFYQAQSSVLKSKAAIPSVEYMSKFLAYGDVKRTAKWETNNIKNIFNRYNLAGDNTSLDNDFYGDVLNEINAFLKQAEGGSAFTDKIREIKDTLNNNRSITPKQFKKLNDNIVSLGEEGAEGALKKHLDSYLKSFLEQAGNDLDKSKSLADLFLSKKVAEQFKKAMDDRYEQLSTGKVEGALGRSISAVIGKNIEELEGFSSIAQSMEKSRLATFDKDFRRNNVSVINEADREVSNLRGYSIFKAPANANPLARSLDGSYFPTSLHGIIKQDPKKPYEQMTQLGKLFDSLLSGISRGRAEEITESFFLKKLNIKTKAKLQDVFMNANYDYILNLFKGHALLSPAFQARNGISAFFVNSSHGIDPTDTLKGMEASLYLRGIHPQFLNKTFHKNKAVINSKGRVEISDATLSAKEIEFYELIAKSEKGGVLSSGRAQEISGDGGSSKLDGGTLNPFSLDFVGLKANVEMAGVIEDAVRMGAMQHASKLLQYGIEDSANFSKLLHFDYNVLTNTEKSVMKRLIPFYTYTRKALSRDSRMFQERTGEVYALSKMVSAMESGSTPEREEAVSSFIRDQLGVDVRVSSEGKHSYLLLGGLIPAADFVGLAGKITDKGIIEPSEGLKELLFAFMRNSSPLIKTPAEQAFDFNFYFNKPIKEVQGEMADTFGFAIPSNIAAMLQSVRIIRDLDKVYHAAFNLKNVTRPDLPSPDEVEMGQMRTLLKVLGGVNILENSTPEDNFYFNRVLPTKRDFKNADRAIRKAERKGFLPNIQNAIEQKQILLQKNQLKLKNEQEALDRIRLLAPK